MLTTLEYARAYVAAGLCVIPIRPDGSKAPALGSWKKYQSELPADADLALWFGDGRNGIAVICGAISGGLEVLDFDAPELFDAWTRKVETEAPGWLAKLPQVRTPEGGTHLYFRVPVPPGNDKLAKNKTGKKTLIETRGEGGYVLAPGSPPACHPTGRTYEHVGGPPITEAPMLESL